MTGPEYPQPLTLSTASDDDEALEDVFDNIKGRIHGLPAGQLVLYRDDTLLKLSEAIAAQYLLSSPLPPPLQFRSWFSNASSQKVDGLR